MRKNILWCIWYTIIYPDWFRLWLPAIIFQTNYQWWLAGVFEGSSGLANSSHSAWFLLTQLFSPSVSSAASAPIWSLIHSLKWSSAVTQTRNNTALWVTALVSLWKARRWDGSTSWPAGASTWVQRRSGVRPHLLDESLRQQIILQMKPCYLSRLWSQVT